MSQLPYFINLNSDKFLPNSLFDSIYSLPRLRADSSKCEMLELKCCFKLVLTSLFRNIELCPNFYFIILHIFKTFNVKFINSVFMDAVERPASLLYFRFPGLDMFRIIFVGPFTVNIRAGGLASDGTLCLLSLTPFLHLQTTSKINN